MRRLGSVIAGVVLVISLASHGVLAQVAPGADAGGAKPVPLALQAAAPSQTQPAVVPAAGLTEDAARPIPGIGRLHELSPWSMFLSADNLVKAVMVSLMFASLVTWTVLIAKTVQLSRGRRDISASLTRIAKCRSLAEAGLALGSPGNVLSELLRVAADEVRLSDDTGNDSGIKERAASHFSEIVRSESRSIRYGMGVVATIGATAPFVGLFGTVWGIMNSFIGISKAQTTNLAVVAPGIAEALLATAIGLAAAIPAVIIYNHFSRATKGYMELVGRGSGAVGRLLSRDLDRFHHKMLARAAE